MLKYSLIIPVYNNSDCLKVCLSVIKKKFPSDAEIIVVDDGSTQEGAREVAKKFKTRFLRINKNSGAGNARNKGSKLARGRYLLFLDSDILISQNFFKYLNSKIKNLPENTCLQGVYGMTTPAQSLYSQYKNLYYYYNFFYRINREGFSYVSSHCFLIPKKIFEEIGGFNPKIKTVIEDADLSYRLLKRDYLIEIDRKLKVTHLKFFSFKGLLLNDAHLSFAKAKHILRNILKDETDKLVIISGGKLTEMYPVVLTVFLSPIILVIIIANLLKTDDFRFFSFWGWFLLFILINFNFFRFIVGKRSYGFLLKIAPFYYLDMFFAFLGVILGFFDYLVLGNRY